jgi:hypothetical protein
MSKLSIFTEVINPLGGFDFMQATRLLGVPNLDDYSQFVRETAQNSWDARRDKDSKDDVHYSISIGALTVAQAKTFSTSVFTGDKKADELITQLKEKTAEGKAFVIVRDIGTAGLAGPTEADVGGKKRNFVSFVRNIGQDSHANTDGGGFGFGKSVFFRFSGAKTLITYSHTVDEHGKAVVRLMGMTLNRDCFEQHHCTGRHWWGVKPARAKTEFNQPLTGDQADALAAAIGFQPFGKNETGTAVMIIDPVFQSIDKEGNPAATAQGRATIAEAFRESLVAWYWPRLMGSGEQNGKLICEINHDGKPIKLSDSIEDCPFKYYAFAFEQIQKKIADPSFVPDPQTYLKEVRWKDESYGYLAVFKTNKEERPSFVTESLVFNHPLASLLWSTGDAPAISNHVALIRGPGQVIRYTEMASCSRPSQEYGAVFFLHPTGPKAEEIKSEVKNSEPAAHDEWSAVKSPRAAKILQTVRGLVTQYVSPASTSNTGSSGRMGRVALALGSLWGAGEAAGGTTTDGPGPSPDPAPSDRLPKGTLKFNSRLGKYDNQKCVFVEVAIPKIIGSATKIEVNVTARLLGGESTEIDDEQSGKVIGWFHNPDKEPTKKALLSADKDLEIVKDIIGRKVLLIIRNAENFGLTVEINLK